MHLTLKQEATKPAAKNFLQQQGRFDQFLTTFNQERPHEALNMRYPAEVYTRFATPLQRLTRDRVSLPRPHHHGGALRQDLHRSFEDQPQPGLRRPEIGVTQVEEKIWLVSFMRYDLGFFDHETCRIESAANPFAAKVLPMSPVSPE